MPTAALIFNADAGGNLSNPKARGEAVAVLEAESIDVRQLDGDVSTQLERSLGTDADVIVVAGGDGTVRAAISAHRRHGRPIGILPSGTMNLLAEDYGIPLDWNAAARVIAAGHRRAVDCAVLSGHVFLHAALLGMPARMGLHREKRRGRLSMADRLALAVHAMATLGRDPVLELTAHDPDGGTVKRSARTFAILVGTLAPHLLPRPQRAEVAAGIMTGFAVRTGSRIDFARMVLRGAFGDIAEDPAVDTVRLSAGRIDGPRRRIHVMLDGEGRLVRLPCQIAILSGEVEVLAPAPSSSSGSGGGSSAGSGASAQQ